MKIIEITYGSGKTEYVCKHRRFSFFPNDLDLTTIIITLFFFPLFIVIALTSFEKRVFTNKDNAIRFRDLYYTHKEKIKTEKKEKKEQLKIEKANKKVVSKKIIKSNGE